MIRVGRASKAARNALALTSRRVARRQASDMPSPDGSISVGMKIVAGAAAAAGTYLFLQTGLFNQTIMPLIEDAEEEMVHVTETVAAAVAHTASHVVSGDFEPSYDDLDISTDASGNIVLKWKQDGVAFVQVLDQSGKTISGPGPVAPAAEAAPEPVTTPATPEPVSPAAVEASSVSSSDQNEDQEKILAEILSRLQSIEHQLGSGNSVLAGPQAGADAFPLFTDECHSLLKKHMTPEVFEKCETRVTPGGFTFARAIQSGVDNQDSGVGAYAGDEESYVVFAPLMDRVIEDYHNGYKPTDRHVSDMDASKLTGAADADGNYVISTRIRVGRNIRGLGLSPGITRANRRKVEKLATEALSQLEGDLGGKYYSLSNMSEEDRKQLVADHFLFKKGDRFLQSAGANRDWPEARGIFHNDEKTFLVCVNEEDQMRIISMQQGADAKQVFERLSRGISAVEEKIKSAGYEFAHNDHLGYIHSCPTNCGTGMRASVHAKLPNVGSHPEFKNWCNKLRLQPRGIHGEHSESSGGVYDLSNKERLGKSEVSLVQTMIDGVATLIEAEKALAEGKPLPEKLVN